MRKIKFTVLLISHLISRYLKRLRLRFTTKKTNDPYSQFHIHLNRQSFFLGNNKKKPSKIIKYGVPTLLLFLVLLLVWGILPYFKKENNISEGFIGVYTQDNLPESVTNLLSEPLVKMDKTSLPQPDLADSWTATDEGKTYTFKLKQNLYWSDGNLLKSSDIKFNLTDVTAEYPDDQTIIFRLPESYSPFPTLLTAPILKENSLTGVGNYKVASLEMNGTFIKKMVLTPHNKNLPNLTIRFYPDEKTAKTAFDLGEVESLVGVNETTDEQNLVSTNIKSITNYNKIVLILYNLDDPMLSDEKLRLALTAASPIVSGEERAKSSIQPYSFAYNPDVKDILDNHQQAVDYLQKYQGSKTNPIVLTVVPQFSSLGEIIVNNWKQLGLNASLKVESGIPQNFQALLISEPIPSDPDQYSLWHSTQSKTNIGKQTFAPRVDKSLEDGRKTTDINMRKQQYFDFQKVLADNGVATFLYFPKLNVLYRQKVENSLNTILPLQINILN